MALCVPWLFSLSCPFIFFCTLIIPSQQLHTFLFLRKAMDPVSLTAFLSHEFNSFICSVFQPGPWSTIPYLFLYPSIPQILYLYVLFWNHGSDPRSGVSVRNDENHVSKLLDCFNALQCALDRMLLFELSPTVRMEKDAKGKEEKV